MDKPLLRAGQGGGMWNLELEVVLIASSLASSAVPSVAGRFLKPEESARGEQG